MLPESHPDFVQAQHEANLIKLKKDVDGHIEMLQEMGLDLNPGSLALLGSPPTRLAEAEKITVETHWWGVDIIMNEKLTQNIISGITAGGTLAGSITAALGAAGVLTGGIATLIGAGISGIVALKIAEIKIVNNGQGVHWPITWIQWAALLASVPAGPAGIIAAGLVFIHPVRN